MAINTDKHSASRVDYLIIALLFFVLSTIYYATASGITSSNDGSHYALVRTLIENHSFALQQFDDYAEGNDIALNEDGRLFSDRPPGTALIGAVFYELSQILPYRAHTLPSRHDAQNPRLAYVLLLPALAGAGAGVVLYSLIRLLGVGRAAAFSAVLMVGLGSIQWKYSSVLFSHALSALLVVSALYLTIRITRFGSNSLLEYGVLGILLGFATLVEYSNFLLVPILLAYLLLQMRGQNWHELTGPLIALIAGGLISALFLAAYNMQNFGSPFKLSYSYAINYPWASSFLTTFNFPLVSGMKGLLIGGVGEGWCDGPCSNTGLFYLSPVLLFALPGWYLFFRRARSECLLTAVLFLVYLVLFAMHRTFHGFTADGRYLAPFLILLSMPLAFVLHWLYSLHSRPILRAALVAAVWGLFLWSLYNNFLHIGTSYNYHLDAAEFSSAIHSLANWPELGKQVFRNTANLPLLWLIEFGFALLLAAAMLLVNRASSSSSKGPG